MKLRKIFIHILFIHFIFLISCNVFNKTISIKSLLKEMIDRESIALYPEPFYSTKQFSSYDRSTIDSKQKSWFANWDRSMFIRKELNQNRIEYVMLDAEGPGAIVRFWMTFGGDNPGNGVLRIYLDKNETPVIEGKPFSILGGGLLAGNPLSASVSNQVDSFMRGHNLYLPIPYARKCKITYESEHIKDPGAKTGGECVYYNIICRNYSQDTKVKTFTKSELLKNKKLIDWVCKILNNSMPPIRPDQKELIREKYILKPGASITKHFDGPKAINYLKIKLKSDNPLQALRSTVLNSTFDGENTVWCPVGDFFCTSYQPRIYRTWYTGVEKDSSLVSNWIMPFKEKCEFEIRNFSEHNVEIEMDIKLQNWKWNERSMHFGATWKNYENIATGEFKSNEGEGNPFDLNYCKLDGQGIYVSDALSVFNTMYAWWGEGDEKIYIDQDTFPSHIGTGTEDYYGYAWCRPELFNNHPFIAQTSGDGNFNPGLTLNIRQRSLDGIPFSSRLRFDMELWHWTKAIINFSPVSFWYLKTGGNCYMNKDSISIKHRAVLKREDIISPWIINNKIEGENLVLKNSPNGDFWYENTSDIALSKNTMLSWIKSDKNDELDLELYSEIEGFFQIIFFCTTGKKYGTFGISINQEQISDSLNVNNEKTAIKKYELGKIYVKKGVNQLKIRTLTDLNSLNENAFGLDFILFNKAD